MRNALYAQSGGVTAVINATACGVIETARRWPERIGTVYAGMNGIVGVLREDLVDTSAEDPEQVARLRDTPGGAFGSCRYKLPASEPMNADLMRLFEVLQAHDIGYFFYNGGGDSQDTSHKILMASEAIGYPLTCIGIPKTVDNDLAGTDCCPGFGSVARYVAISVQEASLDVASMCDTSTKVFVLEVMGRHAGWIAAASGLAGKGEGDPPHVILFPEVAFDQERFLERVHGTVENVGYCVIVASEGAKNPDGSFLSASSGKDAFGHAKLGGVAAYIASLVKNQLGFKYHFAISDYLQRSARHIASKTDLDHAYAVGAAAVDAAAAGTNGVMITIDRKRDVPYQWKTGTHPLDQVANREVPLPRDYITPDGFGITLAARTYLAPLIEGDAPPRYEGGLPVFARLRMRRVGRQLPEYAPPRP